MYLDSFTPEDFLGLRALSQDVSLLNDGAESSAKGVCPRRISGWWAVGEIKFWKAGAQGAVWIRAVFFDAKVMCDNLIYHGKILRRSRERCK